MHLEIIQERLSREFDLDLITTAPSVVYRVHLTNGRVLDLHNPADMPDPVKIDHIEEPWIKATIFVPDEYLGQILALCQERRGVQLDLTYAGNRAMVVYRLPLNEVVFDFYDRLKSVSRGYASFDYQIEGYDTGDLVLMNILINGEPVDALSIIVHRGEAERRGRALCERLKELIPRQLFQIAIQAAIGGRVIARETVKALAQGRAREMLRRRCDPQAQAAGKTEGRQKADAPKARPAQGRIGEMLRRRRDAASASCWRSRRKAKSGCASSARSTSRNPPSSRRCGWGTAEPARKASRGRSSFRSAGPMLASMRSGCPGISTGTRSTRARGEDPDRPRPGRLPRPRPAGVLAFGDHVLDRGGERIARLLRQSGKSEAVDVTPGKSGNRMDHIASPGAFSAIAM